MAVGVDNFRFLPSVGTWVFPLKPAGLGKSAPAFAEDGGKAVALPEAVFEAKVLGSDPFGDLLDMHMEPAKPQKVEAANPEVSLLDGLFEATKPAEVKQQAIQSCRKEGTQPFFLKPSVATWLQLRRGAEAPPWQVASQKPVEATSRAKSLEGEWETDFQSCIPKSVEDASAAAVPIIQVASQKTDGESPLVFKPPPPPAASLSVGGNTPKESVVVLEDVDFTKPGAESAEKPDKRKSSQTLEELVGTRNVDDDEESLLGGDRDKATPANESRHLSRRTWDDGVDSASESELGDQAAKLSATPAIEKQTIDSAGPPPSSTSGESRPVPPLNIKGSTAGSSSSMALPKASSSSPAAGGAASSAAPQQSPRRPEVTVQKSGASREPHAPEAVIHSRKANAPDGNGMATQVQVGGANFVVKVPNGFPGLQYRRSKKLDDRGTGYAKDGDVIGGQVEGEWLRVKGKDGGPDVFLPMKVAHSGQTHNVLQPLPPAGQALPAGRQQQQQPMASAEAKEDQSSAWFWDFFSGCRCGGLAPDTEVIVGEDHIR